MNFNEGEVISRLDFLQNRYHSFLIGSINYRDNNNQLIDRRGFLHFRNAYRLATNFKAEAFFQTEFDEFRLLKERYLFGSGLRYSLDFNDSNSVLNGLEIVFGSGIMYETEVLNEENIYISYIWRNTNYLTLNYSLTKTVDFNSVSYFQIDALKGQDYRILNESILLFRISKYLQLTISLNYRYDSEPPPGIQDFDLYLRNGLRINL